MMSLKIEKMETDKKNIKSLPLQDALIIPKHPKVSIFSGMSGSGKSNLARNLLERFFVFPPSSSDDVPGDCDDLPGGSLSEDDDFDFDKINLERDANRSIPKGTSGKKKPSTKEPTKKNKDGTTPYFERVFFFSPTNDDMFDGLIHEDQKFPTCNPDDLQQILDLIKEEIDAKGISKSKRNLIIFDDVISERKLLSSKSFDQCFMASRHYNLSVWCLSQKFHSIPRMCRLQASNIFLFRPIKSELKRLVDEHQPEHLTTREFIDLVRYGCCEDQYSFLHINLNAPPETRFRKNLDQILNVS